jgi:D-alanyl-D-alanine carboxypeptidase/D-alanyl-D-alanine-endopeptidase (penicillin-binding protein 4)
MKQVVKLGCLFLLSLSPLARADMPGDIDAVLHDKLLAKASVGIEMVRISDGKEVYEHQSRTPLTPASNLKLATTSTALDKLGPDFKFRTYLYLHDGDLVLIGDGDPSMGDSEYLKRVGWRTTQVYETWAEQLKKMGVYSIRNILVDDSVFDTDTLHARWPTNQIDHWYVAEVGGLNFNINCVDFMIDATQPGRVRYSVSPNTHYLNVENTCVAGKNEIQLGRKPGTNDVVLRGEAAASVPGPFQETVHDPSLYAGAVLAEVVSSAGVHMTGSVQRNRNIHSHVQRNAEWKVVGIHETPLAVALARANKDSINLYAECLAKRVGHEATGEPGSWENGAATVGAFLKKAGAAPSEFKLDDGSGLSKQNQISPHALVRVLQFNYASPSRDAFLSSLSVAGVDGTLEDRFRQTPDLKRRVIGKSGFVEGVSCLTGYLRTRDNQLYAFSIMMNGIPYKSNTLAKSLQEKIVRALDTHTNSIAAR